MNPALLFSLRLLTIFLSYLFISWIAYTIYADIFMHTADRKKPTSPPIQLSADSGPTVFKKEFNSPQIIIGRDTACDFYLEDETISLRHCKLSYDHKQWWVEDLQSTNGTFLNNTIVEEATVLINNDRLMLGQVNITIKIH